MDFLKNLAKRILKLEARLVLKKYKPKIIAVTGSVGKTLAKEALYLVLSKHLFVRKSEKSFTAELGIPLAIIGCPYSIWNPFEFAKNILFGVWILIFKSDYPEWIILEIDADKPGDLVSAADLIEPDVVVLTAIGDVPAHIETFFYLESFLAEQKYFLDSLKRNGVLVYDADDATASRLASEIETDKISCGATGENVVRAFESEILYGNGKTGSIPIGMSFNLEFKSEQHKLNIFETIGAQNIKLSLLAFGAATHLGLVPKDITSALNKFVSIPGRMKLVQGIKETIIIDDSYNSSPQAMSVAIKAVSEIKAVEKKIFVIGDMLELGRFSSDEHKKIAISVKDAASNVICVGIRTRKLRDELINLGFDETKIISIDTSIEAGKELQGILDVGDIVLVKGSQAMRMERIVEEIMKHPEDKGKLLVRQEPEWLNRV
jgi:UDP-N-acetylmuramoyl-tripeptide--D-alanyl-D-alanine ligase